MLSVYRYLVILIILVAIPVHAQTPTPHPNALPPTFYNFRDLSSPEIELTGTWVIAGGCLRGVNIGASITFHVTNASDFAHIVALAINTTGPRAYFNMYIDDALIYGDDTFKDFNGLHTYYLDLPSSNSEIRIQITTTNGDYLHLCHLELFPDYQGILDAISSSSSGSVSGTVSSATPTPIPYAVYDTISGVSGTVSTRFDYLVTVGDVAVSSALLFLMFSLWAGLLIVVVVRHDG